MSTPFIYGIPNCDSCRKAVSWFKENKLPYHFHDLRADGAPDPSQLRDWCDQLGWETVLNRRSATYRSLAQEDQAVHSAEDAIALIVRHPLLLKRPLIYSDRGIVAGFDPDRINGILPHA